MEGLLQFINQALKNIAAKQAVEHLKTCLHAESMRIPRPHKDDISLAHRTGDPVDDLHRFARKHIRKLHEFVGMHRLYQYPRVIRHIDRNLDFPLVDLPVVIAVNPHGRISSLLQKTR